jgi:hypothetical protein
MRHIPIEREFGAPVITSIRTPAICRWLRAIFFGLVTMAALITVEALSNNQGPWLGEFLTAFFIIVGFLAAD